MEKMGKEKTFLKVGIPIGLVLLLLISGQIAFAEKITNATSSAEVQVAIEYEQQLIDISATQSACAPRIVYVDDDYTPSTPGWGYNHFNKIQKGINAVGLSGTVIVHSGIYSEHLLIYKPLRLLGDNKYTTIIDGSEKTGGPPVPNMIKIIVRRVTIRGFTIQNGGNGGIYVQSEHCTISNNIIQDNNANGISLSISYFTKADYSTISNNIIQNNSIGVQLSGTSYNIISENVIRNNSNNGISGTKVIISSESPCTYNQITGNTIAGNGDDGIWFYESDGNEIRGNTVDGNIGEGIMIWYSSDCTVSDNTVINTHEDSLGWGDGILIEVSANCICSGNTVTDNEALGIILQTGSVNCRVEYNVIERNADGRGIGAWGAINSTIKGNIIREQTTPGGCGIQVSDSIDSAFTGEITENSISENYYGIVLDTESTNSSYQITENNIVNNTYLGFFAYRETRGAYVYHNNFITNQGGDAYADKPYNTYDYNYWSDYNGIDANHDGIGDTPYGLPPNGLAKDYHPLMSPWS
ncbi:MAG: right-handed parallel beta-helix repeat-containing protein [Euryarchaeota archaeon]|nr:right-handed parallel beta-helix repeat-containing protein [Euryarchaeota archaeon]